jgi:hypothetical protein
MFSVEFRVCGPVMANSTLPAGWSTLARMFRLRVGSVPRSSTMPGVRSNRSVSVSAFTSVKLTIEAARALLPLPTRATGSNGLAQVSTISKNEK